MVEPVMSFQVKYNFTALNAKMAKAGKKALMTGARVVVSVAKKLSRKRPRASSPGQPFAGKSGNATSSIKTAKNRSGSVVWVGGTFPKGAHMHLLEHGTTHMQPRPTMQIALNTVKHSLAAKYANTF
jgi:HK97 gp10 family phage protein